MVRDKCNLELDNSNSSMLLDINNELNKAHFNHDVIDEYIEKTVQLHDDYASGLGFSEHHIEYFPEPIHMGNCFLYLRFGDYTWLVTNNTDTGKENDYA